jgi:hypothetical protein
MLALAVPRFPKFERVTSRRSFDKYTKQTHIPPNATYHKRKDPCSASSITQAASHNGLSDLNPLDMAHCRLVSVHVPLVRVLRLGDGIPDGGVLGSVLADVSSGKDGEEETDGRCPETNPDEDDCRIECRDLSFRRGSDRNRPARIGEMEAQPRLTGGESQRIFVS